MNIPRMIVMMVFMLSLAACSGQEGGDADQQAENTSQAEETRSPAERAAVLDEGPRAAQTLKLDNVLAERGQALFEEKLCSDCHTLGEADIAPNLLGVLDRRTQNWLFMQITQPEWMNQHDPITKGLIEEYGLEMVGTGVQDADAEAILHYLLRESENATP